MEIARKNTVDLWKESLMKVAMDGHRYKDGDGRMCRESRNAVIVLETPSQADVDKLIELMSSSEKWIYPSRDELSGIMFKEINTPIYDYTYGGRIFNFASSIDQINSFVIPILRKDSTSRRATVMVYDPVQDSDMHNRNTPGLIYIHFMIREKKLHISASIRSNDLFFGWPANIYQIYCLQKYVSERIGSENGSITIFSNSAHVFEEDFGHANELLGVNLE